jgi:RNA polymerase sigma-70 factor (sigma-E family)
VQSGRAPVPRALRAASNLAAAGLVLAGRDRGRQEDDGVAEHLADNPDDRAAGPPTGDYTEFVTAASRQLLHAAWLLTGDRHRAEDLVQTTLARLYVAWPRVRRDDALAYARRVLVNLHTDWWRRRPWRERPTDAVPEQPAREDGPARADQRDALVRALARLGRRERAVVVLRYYVDLGEREVAQLLGISPGGVKSAASRALAKLRVSAELSDRPDPGGTSTEMTTSLGGTR